MLVEGPRVLGCAKPCRWASVPSLPQGNTGEFQRPATTPSWGPGSTRASELARGILPPQRPVFCLPLSLYSRAEAPPAWARQMVLGFACGQGRGSAGPLLIGPQSPRPPSAPCSMRPTLNVSKRRLQGVGVTSGHTASEGQRQNANTGSGSRGKAGFLEKGS